MKFYFMVLFLTLLLLFSACQMPQISNETASLAEVQLDESTMEQSINAEELELDKESEVDYWQEKNPFSVPKEGGIPFALPEINHLDKKEIYRAVHGFSSEFLLPEFESIQSMPYTDDCVMVNLLHHIDYDNVFEDQLKTTNQSLGRHVDDLNAIGRYYFGETFSIPPEAQSDQVGPNPENPDYYHLKLGRCGMSPYRYELLDIVDDLNSQGKPVIKATLIPYNPLVDWENSCTVGILFCDFADDSQSGTYLFGYYEEPYKTSAEKNNILEDYYLVVPQERLGTITVTFERTEDDGRLIMTSCRYNRTNI